MSVDNLGFGELSCYSSGAFRGATTGRIDAFAQSGCRLTDPHEREPYSLPYLHTWTIYQFNEIIEAFKASVGREPPFPTGAPLDYAVVRAKDR